MNVRSNVIWFLGICLSLHPICASGQTAATEPATRPAPSTAPADKAAFKPGKNGAPNSRFTQLHDAFLWRGKEGPMGVLFIGDSITEGWIHSANQAPDVWKKYYWQYQPANFGISGDATQHVLWRIEHGELDGLQPKVVVVMIGTNNIPPGNPPDEIAAADTLIVQDIHEKIPDAKVLLLGIFPRGADPQDPKVAIMREKIKDINAQLAKLDDGNKTRYLDIGGKFLDDNGAIPVDVMKDALHPSPKGYQIWADAMQPLLDEMMK